MIRQRAERLRDGLLFVGFKGDNVKQMMSKILEGSNIELNPSAEDMVSELEDKYQMVMNEINDSRVLLHNT